ncbi:MAG: hypothetical protein WDN28_06970 [Chthoniobacter sp.]
MRPVLALFFILCTLAVRATELTPAEAQALLKNLQEHRAKYPSLSADFVEERTSHLLNKPITSEGRSPFKSPTSSAAKSSAKAPVSP